MEARRRFEWNEIRCDDAELRLWRETNGREDWKVDESVVMLG